MGVAVGGASVHSEGELGQSGGEFGGVLITRSVSRGQAGLPCGGKVTVGLLELSPYLPFLVRSP